MIIGTHAGSIFACMQTRTFEPCPLGPLPPAWAAPLATRAGQVEAVDQVRGASM